jgi:hypothetical protein
MELSFNQFMFSVLAAVVVALACVIIGGWLVWKCKSGPGERFIGPEPKGQVFTIADAAIAPDMVDGEQDQKMLKRTEQFMERMLGGKP